MPNTSWRLSETLPDDFIEMLQIRVADFGGDDFDWQVRVSEQFVGAVGTEVAQPESGRDSGLLFDDARELVMRYLAALRECLDAEPAGHFLAGDLADGFKYMEVPRMAVGMACDVFESK